MRKVEHMRSGHRINSLALLLAVLGLLVLAACEGEPDEADEADDVEEEEVAGDPVSLNLAHYYNESPEAAGEARLAEEVTERSGGDVDIQVQWGEVLGDATEIPGLVADGAADMGSVAPHFGADPFPLYQLSTIPFPSTDPATDLERQGELQQEVFESDPFVEELEEEHNQKALLHQPLAPYFVTSNIPECGIDAFEGERVRSIGEFHPVMLEEIGATPVTLTTGEMFEGLERGTVDAVTIPLAHMLTYDLHEVADYICGPVFYLGNGNTATVNLDTWEDLSGDQQELITETAEETQDWFLDYAIDQEESYRSELEEDLGVEFLDFPQDELEEWHESAPDFLGDWADERSADGYEQIDDLHERIRDITDS